MSAVDDTTQPSDDELLDLARAARAGAYAPYSKFRVGAAVACADGRVFTGANVENAASPAGVCAERVALPQAVIAGGQPVAIAIAGDSADPCMPCGICRQVLNEFNARIRVLATGTTGVVAELVLADDLLPHAFGPDDLRS